MKIRVAVMFGGRSTEHEISIISALQAIRYMDRDKYEIWPLYITKDGDFYTGEVLTDIARFKDVKAVLAEATQVDLVRESGRVYLKQRKKKLFKDPTLTEIDLFFPVVHGTNVEDGALQGYLETLQVPYVGCDVCSSALGMNKYAMKAVLKDCGIPVLPAALYTWTDQADMEALCGRIEQEIGYPVIIKPVNLGSSIGISKAEDRAGLEEALETAFTFSRMVMAEHAITKLREINCSVLGDYSEAIPSECEEPFHTDQILSFFDKYQRGRGEGGAKGAKGGSPAKAADAQGAAKTSDGATGSKGAGMASLSRQLPARITPEQKARIQDISVRTFKALDCSGVSRIDCMIDEENGEIYVNEINTIPGSLSFYLWQATGVSYPELLDRLIELALKRQREKEKLVFSFDSSVLEGVSLGGAKGSKGSKG